ncbi:MAG: DNA polymerase III subunit gamma/tau [Anaerolineae bacterium]|nr:DNA polymerase III subunit gamma/tau [Anaerolineae bacterium]
MGQALYRKWRPQTFDDVVGQEHIVQTLRYALQTGHIHHAYLLAGPRGTGKTTTARLIAKAVNCLAPEDERPCNRCEICTAINAGRLMDLIEIDAASNTGVDNIRDLLEKVGFLPTQATYKVYVVDEVHMLSTAAFNALLKTLEEPPEHVIFVLATTEPHKIPETILSRCQRFQFRRIPLEALVGRLDVIAKAESVDAEPQALEIIARAATGSMRDAISLFDQMAANGTITADYVRTMLGAERREVVQDLLRAWIDKDLTAGLQIINGAIDGGADPRQLARQTADFLRGLLLMRLGAGHTWSDPTEDERERLAGLASRIDPDHLVKAIRLFSEVASKQRTGWQPQLPLELAFVEAALQSPQNDRAALNDRDTSDWATTPGTRPTRTPPATTRAMPTQLRPQRRPAATTSIVEPATSTTTPSLTAPSHTTPNIAKETPGQSVAQADAEKPAIAADTAAAIGTSPATEESPAPADQARGITGTSLDPTVVENIRNRWPELLRNIQPVALGALLRDADVGGTDNQGRLVLTFQHAFHCKKVSEATNIRRIEDLLVEVFRQPIAIRCLPKDEWKAQRSSLPVVGAPPQAARRPPANRAPRVKQPDIPLEEDELIRRAQEELGAVARIND